MLDEEDRKRAGQVVGSLLDRQANLGNADDPFSLLKQLTDTHKQPSSQAGFGGGNAFSGLAGNFGSSSNRRAGGSNALGMNMSSYAAF